MDTIGKAVKADLDDWELVQRFLPEGWEQMARATYRALHYWIKSQYEAVQFGLFSFEDAFLSHFEWMLDNGQATTVGKIILPRLPSSNLLTSPAGGDIVEGTYKTG